MTQVELSRAFKAADTDGDGYLDYEDVSKMVLNCNGLRELAKEDKNLLVDEIFERLDIDQDYKISLPEFQAGLRLLTKKVDPTLWHRARGRQKWIDWNASGNNGLIFTQPRFVSRVMASFEIGAGTFSHDELVAAFEKTTSIRGTDELCPEDMLRLVNRCQSLSSLSQEDREALAEQMVEAMDSDDDGTVSLEEFEAALLKLGAQIDIRLGPQAMVVLLSGLANSLIVPALPELQAALHLSTADLGVLVGVVGLSGLAANLPSTCLSETRGRRWLVTVGSLVSFGSFACLVYADGMAMLVVSRLLIGVGVSFICTGATMFCSDVSTPLNRARSMAPLQLSYSGGTACGPVVGGVLLSTIGFEAMFTGFGLAFLAMAASNHFLTNETTTVRPGVSIIRTIQEQLAWWPMLIRNQEVRHNVLSGFGYWAALGGAQLTVLPLMLVEQPYALTAAGSAGIFSVSVCVMVAAMPFAATLIDRVPKPAAIAGGFAWMGSGLFLAPYVPMAAEMLELPPSVCIGGLLGFWSLGATALSNAPSSWIPELTSGAARGPCFALLYSAMDGGFLAGSAFAGVLALYVDKPYLLQGVGAGMLSWAGYLLHCRTWRK